MLKDFNLAKFLSLHVLLTGLLIAQFFIPLNAVQEEAPICTNNKINCTIGTPVCKEGLKGFAACRSINSKFIPGCKTSFSFELQAVRCATTLRTQISERPSCVNKIITCATGTPTCSMGTAICGSKLGLMGSLGGPGCNTMNGFNVGAAFCSDSAPTPTPSPTPCIICPLYVPDCLPGEVSVPQTCTQCIHCEKPSTKPTCVNKIITCTTGTPTCKFGIPICGSKLGLTGRFSGQGCNTMNGFSVGAAFCKE